MALGLREVLVILRAKDQASRVIAGVGQSLGALGGKTKMTAGQAVNMGTALIGAGTIIGGIGAVGLSFMNSATDAAMEYNKTVAVTKTQVDDASISFQDLRKIGLDIANKFPVGFEGIQKSLYDIFSSMDVNLSEARTLITGFAKAAVAGNTDIQTASRATIAIMNAFKVPPKEVNKVLDFQFQLVRKGVGTYEEFASTIGRSIPSAARAGQSYQTLGGMLAFLTRNGLSTAMASASAGRALDAMANPKIIERMEDMGLKVRDAKGEFLPMVDLVGQLAYVTGKMPGPEKAMFFSELFKGAGGTIQARRFFDLAFKNFGEFEQRVKDMSNAGGQMSKAFGEMMETPANKALLLNNRYKAMKIEVGEKLIPAKLKLMEIISGLLDRWNRLSPGMQNFIVKAAAIASIVMVVVGVILAVTGVIVTLAGALMFIGVPTFGAAIAILGGLVLAVIAVIAIIILVIKYHKQIAAAAKATWNFIKDAAVDAWQNYILPVLQAIGRFFTETLPRAFHTVARVASEVWATVTEAIGTAWDTIQPYLEALWGWISEYIIPIFTALGELAAAIWERITQAFNAGWTMLSIVFNVISTFVSIWVSIVTAILTSWVDIVVGYWKIVFNLAAAFIKAWFRGVQLVFGVFIAVIKSIWQPFWSQVYAVVLFIWNVIKGVIESALLIIKGIIQFWTGLIKGDWGKVWEGIKTVLSGVWHGIETIVENAIDFLKRTISNGLDAVVSFFGSVPWRVLQAIMGLKDLLFDFGGDIIQGLIDGIGAMAGLLWDAAKKIGKKFVDGLKDFFGLFSPSRLMKEMGENVMAGFGIGLQSGWQDVTKQVDRMQTSFGANKFTLGTPNIGGVGGATNITIAPGAVQVQVEGNATPETVAALNRTQSDMLTELARTLEGRRGNNLPR